MTTYAEQLIRNVRAARARLGIDQESVATRMRALGFDVWVRQTVARVEGGKRRLTAEEVFGLALALETRVTALIEPVQDDGPVELPSGAELPFLSAHELIWGGVHNVVIWDGDVPEFPDTFAQSRSEGYEDIVFPPPRVRRGPDHSESIRRASRKNQPRTPRPGEQD